MKKKCFSDIRNIYARRYKMIFAYVPGQHQVLILVFLMKQKVIRDIFS